MFTYLRSVLFSLLALLVIVAPQVASAAIDASVGGCTGSVCGGISVGSGGVGGGPFGLPSGSIYNIIGGFVDWLLAIFGFLGILGFVISGIMYLVSAGNDALAKTAKSGMMYSIIGIVVGLSGFIIMQAVNGLLSGMGGNY